MRAEVANVIDSLRPALQADGGDVLLRDVDAASGVVTIEIPGGCGMCASGARNALEAGIERILRDRVPGVTQVVRAACAEAGPSCAHP